MHHHTIAAAISFASLACAGQSVVRTYDRDSAVFPNPERGWIWTNQPFCSGTTALSFVAFDELRARSITLVDQVYVIDQFRDAQLSESFLESLTNQALRPDSTRNRVWVQDFPVELAQAGHLKLKSA
jgi:hypothetical protein